MVKICQYFRLTVNLFCRFSFNNQPIETLGLLQGILDLSTFLNVPQIKSCLEYHVNFLLTFEHSDAGLQTERVGSCQIKAAACSELFSSKLHQYFLCSSIDVERPTQLSKSSWYRLHQKIEKKLVKFVPGSIFNLLKQAHVASRGIVSPNCNYTIMIFIYSKLFKILLFTFKTSQSKQVQQNIKQFVARMNGNAVHVRVRTGN